MNEPSLVAISPDTIPVSIHSPTIRLKYHGILCCRWTCASGFGWMSNGLESYPSNQNHRTSGKQYSILFLLPAVFLSVSHTDNQQAAFFIKQTGSIDGRPILDIVAFGFFIYKIKINCRFYFSNFLNRWSCGISSSMSSTTIHSCLLFRPIIAFSPRDLL